MNTEENNNQRKNMEPKKELQQILTFSGKFICERFKIYPKDKMSREDILIAFNRRIKEIGLSCEITEDNNIIVIMRRHKLEFNVPINLTEDQQYKTALIKLTDLFDFFYTQPIAIREAWAVDK